MSTHGEQRQTTVSTLQGRGDTIVAMALLWAITAFAFVWALTRM